MQGGDTVRTQIGELYSIRGGVLNEGLIDLEVVHKLVYCSTWDCVVTCATSGSETCG